MELLGRKLGMTQIFADNGDRVAVTVVETGPCTVIQKKTIERDGYCALQLGFQERREKRTTRPLRGHFAKANTTPKRFLFEVRLPPKDAEGFEVGQQISLAGHFSEGQRVDVTGTTKGRGFTGVVKRWSMPTRAHAHGSHEFFRHGGSVGAGSFPGRIFPGLHMAGHYGHERVTTLGLRIVRVDAERNLLYLSGSVPGHPEGIVRVRPAVQG